MVLMNAYQIRHIRSDEPFVIHRFRRATRIRVVIATRKPGMKRDEAVRGYPDVLDGFIIEMEGKLGFTHLEITLQVVQSSQRGHRL